MFVTYILSKVRNYMRYRETVRELSQLTDRELDDLGISRFQIESVARRPRRRIIECCIAASPAPAFGGRFLFWTPASRLEAIIALLRPEDWRR